MPRILSLLGGRVTVCFPDCNKVNYGHRETAMEAVVAMEKKGSSGLEPYYCELCSSWHIGHNRD